MAVVVTTTVQDQSPLRVVQDAPPSISVQPSAPTSTTVQEDPPS